jgi:hypothetical protein
MADSQVLSPAIAAMSEPPTAPGSLRSECHSDDPLAKSPSRTASCNSFMLVGSLETGKVSLSFLVGKPTLTLSAWVCYLS